MFSTTFPQLYSTHPEEAGAIKLKLFNTMDLFRYNDVRAT
jgi:hypothetical protein